MATASNQVETVYTREDLYVALQHALQQRNRFAEQLNAYDGGNHRENFTPGTWLLHCKDRGLIKEHKK